MTLLTRKELPAYSVINKKINLPEVLEYCVENGYTNYDTFNDVKYSTSDKFKSFLLAHSELKDTAFKENTANSKEGELYKQLYLTEINSDSLVSSNEKISESNKSMFSRMKRTKRYSSSYIAETDELNYTTRNKHVKNIFSNILNMFKSQVTRARLAVLMPNFEIKPHVDYDPSYIVRYHIPIITNPNVIFGVKTKKEIIEFDMPANGNIYFFNSGLLHWVKNFGTQPRLHLIIDTHGQDDLIINNTNVP